MTYSVLISGAGSIGTRHANNLQHMQVGAITTCDPHVKADFSHFDKALQQTKPDVVFVCCPSNLHMEQAITAANFGAHIFIEKPLSHTLEGIDELRKIISEKNLTCMVGCNMRFHPGTIRVKEQLEHGDIGAITSATVYTGSYLPDWRPQQNYKESYSANPVYGGAILDCIHEIDLALWYFGPATLKDAKVEPATSIGLETDGTADLTLEHASGIISNVHLSYIEKKYRRFCDINGTKGNIHWDIADDAIDFNQLYIDEIEHFFDCIEQKSPPMGNLTEAAQALEIALAAKNRA